MNLGSSEQVSVSKLARRVITAAGTGSGIVRASYLEAYGAGYEDMLRRVPDCSLAHDLVGFTPARTLDDIISAVIDDQRLDPGSAAPSPVGGGDRGDIPPPAGPRPGPGTRRARTRA